jgi:hypothetical protein
MKKIVFFAILSTLFTSCKHIIAISDDNIVSAHSVEIVRLHEGAWYSNFKDEVFIQALKKVYSPNFALYFDSSDASSAVNIERLNYNTEIRNVIDSLANSFSQRREIKVKVERSPVIMDYCIDYRNSNELDSITLKFYKRFHNSE